MAGELIPFGKYKGKPLEAMVQDRQYLDWLLTQSWFRERHANIYTLIVNNFQEPADTPEHNALQAKFLKPEFRLSFVRFLIEYDGFAEDLKIEFEHHGFDVRLRGPTFAIQFSIEIKPTVGDDYPAVLRQIKAALSQVGDRYKHVPYDAFGEPVLFLQEYTGQGATCDEFIAIFEASNIKVVFLDEIELADRGE